MITAKINDEGAQVYMVMKGARASVGKIASQYKPHHIAVRCTLSERAVVRKFLTNLQQDGYWQDLTKEKTTRAVHIKLEDVREVLKQLDKL
jgi:DNA-directed RNA polymerase specialized sigma54-like protein